MTISHSHNTKSDKIVTPLLCIKFQIVTILKNILQGIYLPEYLGESGPELLLPE